MNVKLLSLVQLFATPWTIAYSSSILGIFQARELEWVAISFSIISPKHLCPGKGLERCTSWGCYWSSPSHGSSPGSHAHLQMSGFMASTVTLASLLLVFPPNTPQILKFPFLSSFFFKKMYLSGHTGSQSQHIGSSFLTRD